MLKKNAVFFGASNVANDSHNECTGYHSHYEW